MRDELSEIGPALTPVYSSQPHGTETSDPVGKLGDKIIAKRAEFIEKSREIRTLDLAVSKLSERKQTIIRMKYMDEYQNMDKVIFITMRRQHTVSCERTYFNVKNEAIEELAKMLGEWEETEVAVNLQ